MWRVLAVPALGFVLAGCNTVVASRPAIVAPNWVMPWQIAPGTELTAKVHNDVPQTGVVEGWGRVFATPRVLASLPYKLRAKRGRNRTLEPCKRQIELAAAPFGVVRVEAASLGPERRSRDGLYNGKVEIRVVYARQSAWEVRQATLRCSSRSDGSIVDAKAVFPINAEDGSDVRRVARR